MATLRCRVTLLDDSIIERALERKAVGQVLFDKVCEYLNLLERDYFGLAAWDSSNRRVWLDLSKRVDKQITSHDPTFTFTVKFYPPNPSELAEDITRYLLCLQLRRDILTSRLPCPSDMLAVLGSYTIQSEFGDYNPELHGKEFFSRIPLAPNQTPELEEEVAELHRTLKSMTPAQADQLFLQNVKMLDMYGVYLYPAQDTSGGDVMVGVCADGLVVYEDEERIQGFLWPRVLNMSYRRNNFNASVFLSEDGSKNIIKFILPSYRACKCLWRDAVAHHTFFRDNGSLDKAPEGLLPSDSQFRFGGLAQAESLEVRSTIERPPPRFTRSAMKRKAKENLLMALKRPNRSKSDDWFQVLGSDEPWPIFTPGKEKLPGGESLAYKEREEMDKPDNEWFQLLGGHFVPTQYSFPSLSSDTDILESATFHLSKMQADDWFVLLEPNTYQPAFWLNKTLPLSPQSTQSKQQSEELEWTEGNSETSFKVVELRNRVDSESEYFDDPEGNCQDVLEQNEELGKKRRILMRTETVEESLELGIEGDERILNVVREKIEQGRDGEEMPEIKPFTGQSQEAFVEIKIRGVQGEHTEHEAMLTSSRGLSEEIIEELEGTLLEVENIEQRLQEIKWLKGRLQEVEILRQNLQEQQAGSQRMKSDDWYVLLEHKPMESSPPTRLPGLETSEQMIQDVQLKRQEQVEREDWYLLLDRKPSVVFSGSAERKTEIRHWREEEHLRANTIAPIQMKDDWYIWLELPPEAVIQPAPPSSEGIDIQSSWVNVLEEEKTMAEEKKWREEREVHGGETHLTLPEEREVIQKQVDDDWFTLHDVSPEKRVADANKETREEEEEQHVETIMSEEERRETSHEAVQTNPILFEKKGVAMTSVPTTLIYEATSDLRSQQPVLMEEKSVSFHEGPEFIKEKRGIVGGVEKKIPATTPESDDNWAELFTSEQIKRKVTATDFHKEKAEEEEQQVKTITFGEERRETSHEVIQTNPILFNKRGFATVSVPVTLFSEGTAGVRTQQTVLMDEKSVSFHENPKVIKEKRVIDGGVEKRIPATAPEGDDNWAVLFTPEQIEKKVMATGIAVDVHKEKRKEKQQPEKTITFEEKKREISHEVIQTNLMPFTKKGVAMVSVPISEGTAGRRSQQTTAIEEKEVILDKYPKIVKENRVTIRGMEKKIPAAAPEDDINMSALFTPEQKKVTVTGIGGSDMLIVEEKTLREVQKGRLKDDMKRGQVVEDRKLLPYVPRSKVEARHREAIDDWYILLDPVSKKSVSMDRRTEATLRRKKELLKKQAMAEDRTRLAGFKAPSFHDSPMIPAGQPKTSTPTAQSVRVTKPSYQEESLKRLHITQETTQDITLDSQVESESIMMRKKKEAGESIYVRHSILMLEDSDVTKEVLLRQYASISELKRLFMEDLPVSGPTEWDKRLSFYTPAVYPKFSDGDLFTGMDIMGADGLLAM